MISPTFVLIVGATIGYFTTLSMLLPVLPRYVEETLHGDGLAIGVAVGAFAAPPPGPPDRRTTGRPARSTTPGRVRRRPRCPLDRRLRPGGVVPILVGFRLITGLGEGAFFIGAATAAQDLSPDDRTG